MLKLDHTYRVNTDDLLFLAKNSKVIVRAIILYDNIQTDNYSAIVEVINGPEYKYVDKSNFIIIKKSEKLTENTKTMFVTSHSLSPCEDDEIIVYGLKTKWNVRKTDWYREYRADHFSKHGYDVHDMIYKSPKTSSII